jgi:hypothetical protein
MVDSVNSLDLLSAASCAPDSTTFGGPAWVNPQAPRPVERLCNVLLESEPAANPLMRAAPRIPTSTVGALQSFYRSGSRKTFVIVTDDNARMTDATFAKLMEQAAIKNYSLFAFAGVQSGSGGCSVSRPGVVYSDVAKRTDGQVFSICETDWSGYFDDLARQIVMAARTRFTLSQSVSEIVRISADGRSIDAGRYELQGRTVRFKKGALDPEAASLKITYRKK